MTREVVIPVMSRSLPPLPIFYDNALLSFFGVMLFPDDLNLARKFTARKLLNRGNLQSALTDGCQVDKKYLASILDDVADGRPEEKLIRKRRYWASACGQIIKVLFALINDEDPRVRKLASWEQAIKQAERVIGRTERGKRSSFHVQLRRFQRVLHLCGAFEMARERPLHSQSVEGLMLNAMILYERLLGWHAQRKFSGRRNDYLEGDVFWRWKGMAYDDAHGVPFIGIGFDNLISRGRPGRPRKST
jgi:hypothetical protein